MRPLFVTGIGTGIGKTLISAILVQALDGDYWKPIQAGNLESSDTKLVQSLVTVKDARFHLEAYRLAQPMSPHAAAARDGMKINISSIELPDTARPLVVEGAGGLLVPLNKRELVVDLIPHLGAEAIVVSQFYLGSINHTLLTLEALKVREIPVRGVVFNGTRNDDSAEAILDRTDVPCLGYVDQFNKIDSESVGEVANQLRRNFQWI